jgi:hypothetical protein
VHDDGALERLIDSDAEDEGHTTRQGALAGIKVRFSRKKASLSRRPPADSKLFESPKKP